MSVQYLASSSITSGSEVGDLDLDRFRFRDRGRFFFFLGDRDLADGEIKGCGGASGTLINSVGPGGEECPA